MPHGNADVGLLERRCVVHAAAGHRDDVPARLERLHEPELLLRRNAGEDDGAFGHGGKLRVGNCLQFTAGQDREVSGRGSSGETDLLRDDSRGHGVVARNHLHRDAGVLDLTDGGDGGGARGVHHTLQAKKGETSSDVVVFELAVSRVYVAAGQCNKAKAAGGHLIGGVIHGLPVEGDEFAQLAECVGTAIKQSFHRSDLVNDSARLRLVQCRTKHVLGLEWNHVHPGRSALGISMEQSPFFGGDE